MADENPEPGFDTEEVKKALSILEQVKKHSSRAKKVVAERPVTSSLVGSGGIAAVIATLMPLMNPAKPADEHDKVVLLEHRMKAVEQAVNEANTKRWQTNRVFRSDIEDLTRRIKSLESKQQ